MRNMLAILVASVLLTAPSRVEAAVTLALGAAAQNPARANQVVFSGTLTNTSQTEKVFLNGRQATFAGGAGAVLALEPNAFFANVPGILLPGESYTGVLFRLEIDAAASPGSYNGTINVKGGTDIFANGDVASAPFVVLAPFVGIETTDATASEFGPDSGTVTITRTGSTDLPLPVSYTVSGSVMSGTYTTIPASPVIAAGASSVAISLTPIPDNLAQGERLATISVDPSPAFSPGASITAAVFIHDKPADQWRVEKFGANANDPEAQDLADWNLDGVKNMVAYALNLDPKAVISNALPAPALIADYATFSYVPNSAAPDLIYAVEASTDLANWSSSQIQPLVVPNPIPANRVTVRHNIPLDSAEHIFFRLHITRLGGNP